MNDSDQTQPSTSDSETKTEDFRERVRSGQISDKDDLGLITRLLKHLQDSPFRDIPVLLIGLFIGLLIQRQTSTNPAAHDPSQIAAITNRIGELESSTGQLTSSLSQLKGLTNHFATMSRNFTKLAGQQQTWRVQISNTLGRITQRVKTAQEKLEQYSEIEANNAASPESITSLSNQIYLVERALENDRKVRQQTVNYIVDDLDRHLQERFESANKALEVATQALSKKTEMYEPPLRPSQSETIVGIDRIVSLEGRPSDSVFLKLFGQRLPIWSKRWFRTSTSVTDHAPKPYGNTGKTAEALVSTKR